MSNTPMCWFAPELGGHTCSMAGAVVPNIYVSEILYPLENDQGSEAYVHVGYIC